jgi:hypothetical protein
VNSSLPGAWTKFSPMSARKSSMVVVLQFLQEGIPEWTPLSNSVTSAQRSSR